MRADADRERIRRLAGELGRIAPPGTRVYLTGGATAVLEGWREATIDVDMRIEPESDEVLRGIAALKDELEVNVELASPPDFIPELPGWRERSPFVFRAGTIDVHHFDPYSQALSKIERGFDLDLEDVSAMIERKLVEPAHLRDLFDRIEPDLYRYPAIEAIAFRDKLESTLARP